MEGIYRQSYLADEFDSDDESVDMNKRRALPPSVNPASAMRKFRLKRIFISSMYRNRKFFPNANDFRMTMTVPLRGVRSITLTDAKIPIVAGGYDYVAIVLKSLKDHTLHVPKESPGFPSGTLAIIPLIPAVPGGTSTYYRSQTGQMIGGAGTGWRVDIPQGVPSLTELHIQIVTHSGFVQAAYVKTDTGAPGPTSIPDPKKPLVPAYPAVMIDPVWIPSTIPYPIAAEPVVDVAPNPDLNVFFQLEVEHDA